MQHIYLISSALYGGFGEKDCYLVLVYLKRQSLEAVVLVLQLGVQFSNRKINHFICYCLKSSCTTCPIYHCHTGFVLQSILLLLRLGVIYVPPFFRSFYMNAISVLSSKSSGEMQKRDQLRLHRCFALEELLQAGQ